MHVRTIGWSATAPGTGGAAAAALTGDALTIENNQGQKQPYIVDIWGVQQAVGFQQIILQNSGNDTTRNFRFGERIADSSFRLPRRTVMPVVAQELLSVTISGSATTGDVELGFASILYPNLPGVESQAIRWKDLDDRFLLPLTIYASLTSAGAGWSAEELIQSDSTLLKNNREYAILGMECNTNTAGAVYLKGPDTGNVKVACPATTGTNPYTGDYFIGQATQFPDLNLIPVINSGNAPNTYIGLGCDENTPTVLVTIFAALLKEKERK